MTFHKLDILMNIVFLIYKNDLIKITKETKSKLCLVFLEDDLQEIVYLYVNA